MTDTNKEREAFRKWAEQERVAGSVGDMEKGWLARASLAASAPEPSGQIKEPYTLAEIKAKIASNDYSAELMLQHAMLHLDRLAASAGSGPVVTDMVAVCREDANRYCIILRLLGMGEEGDPVAEVQRLQDRAANLQGKQHGWLYDWTHSSATGRPDESFTGFTEDENHARSGTGHRNIRAVYTHPSPPEGAGWKWVPKILSDEMVDAWASARLPGGISQMTDNEANRAVAQANWDAMIAAAPPASEAKGASK